MAHLSVAALTRTERRNLRRQLQSKKKYKRCQYEHVNGMPCQNGVILVRLIQDDEPPTSHGEIKVLRWCRSHAPQEWLDRLGIKRFGGPTSTSGANSGVKRRVSNPHRIMREMVEEKIIDFLKPYMEALTAEKEVVVGHGRSAHVVRVPDHRARMQAAESLFDRVYGKPKQQTVLEGSVAFEPTKVPTDKDRELEVAQILAAAGAIKQGKTPRIVEGAAAVADAKARRN